MRRHIFLDIETTGLSAFRHQMTELAYIIREPDGTETEKVRYPTHTLDGAEPIALEMTRYHERIALQPTVPAVDVLTEFFDDAKDATLVGACTSFDAMRLEMASYPLTGREMTWHHRLRNVEDLVSWLTEDGPCGPAPSLQKCVELVGLNYDESAHHGALYDAYLARDVFDRVGQLWQERGALMAQPA